VPKRILLSLDGGRMAGVVIEGCLFFPKLNKKKIWVGIKQDLWAT
jgi:hypothetical protein